MSYSCDYELDVAAAPTLQLHHIKNKKGIENNK